MGESLNPAELTGLCLFFVAFHLVAIPYFVWAIRNRQFVRDEEAEQVLLDGDSEAAAKPLSLRAILTMILILIFLLPTIFMTFFSIYLATHTSAAASPTAKTILKCPFGG